MAHHMYESVYPTGVFYETYASQPSYTLEPHPYAGTYTTTAHLQPPQPYERSPHRTVSPATSGDQPAESSRRHRRHSSLYRDGDASYVVMGGSPSRRERERGREMERHDETMEKEERRRRRKEKREREAAAAQAMPIPIHRSSTMPTGHTITPAYETRGRRPIIMAEYMGGGGESSARVPIGVDVMEHAAHGRRDATKRYSRTSSTHGRHGSPLGYASNEEEVYRRHDQRRRNRDEVRASHRGGEPFATSAPAPGYQGYDVYGSSYDSAYASTASGFTPPPSRGRRMSSSASRASPAADAAAKNLRWADQQRRSQNDAIDARPKLARADSVKANKNLHGEVKSILKNGGSVSRERTSAAAPAANPLDGLSSAMGGLSMDDDEYRRLSSRFATPTRRHSTYGSGAGSRHRTDYYTPDRRAW